MKAITLTQPWATLMALGQKKVETRSWSRRGIEGERIAIHAAQGFPLDAKVTLNCEPFKSVLERYGITSDNETDANLPRGKIVAVGTLQMIVTTQAIRHKLSDQEIEFGNYEAGRYAWIFADLVAFNHPIRCRGALGLWKVPDALLDEIERERSSS